MHFRKFFLLSLLAGFMGLGSFTATAQQHYVKLGGIYNVGLGSSMKVYTEDGTIRNDGSASITLSQQKLNFGQGWQFNVAAGHFFTDNLGVELALGLLPGKDHKFESRVYHGYVGVSEGLTRTYSSRQFLFQPAVVVRMDPKTLTPYGRLGFTIAKGSISQHDKHTLWTDATETEAEFTGGLGFGFQGGAGVDFVANSQITFFSEVTFSSLAWAPEKWEITSYKKNGQSALDEIPQSEREIKFSGEISRNYDKNGNLITPAGPGNEMKEHFSMHAVGLALGMKLTF